MYARQSMDWENAIYTRRSTRSFEMRNVDEEAMSALTRFAAEMKAPFSHAVSIRFFKADPGRRLYNNLKAAPPDNAAFVAGTDILSISDAGFVGEMFILYATGLGLATCWFGHYSLAELERVMPHLGADAAAPTPEWGYGAGVVRGERAICATPLGYWKREGVRWMDRAQESFLSYRRKPISALLEGNITDESLPTEIRYAFDLARRAPSALNSQHWRFRVSPDAKTISIAMPVGYRHIKWEHPDVDIGACACHFWLGLMIKGVACRISRNEEQGRAVWRFEV
jgi:nitroreductase